MRAGGRPSPPQILQIYREPLKPGCEAAYAAVETEIARAAAQLGCPHPYLGAESLTGAKEVWWFNGYDSPAQQTQVADAYMRNTRLMSALQTLAAKKAGFVLQPIEVFAHHRPALSDGSLWTLDRCRFLVITTTRGDRHANGTVFEAADGTRFVIAPANSREDADALHAKAGADATILSVRTEWSFPAS